MQHNSESDSRQQHSVRRCRQVRHYDTHKSSNLLFTKMEHSNWQHCTNTFTLFFIITVFNYCNLHAFLPIHLFVVNTLRLRPRQTNNFLSNFRAITVKYFG
jgi:hypothetical protein